jgi:hypothetical protein
MHEREAPSVTQDTSRTSNLLMKVWERGPFSKLAHNTNRKPIKQSCTGSFISRCRQKMSWLAKDENDVDARYSRN